MNETEIDDALDEAFTSTFEVKYFEAAGEQEQTRDVSFEISESAEQRLFSHIGRKLSDSATERGFDPRLVQIWMKLSENAVQLPPWFELDTDKRTYDLELSTSEYGKLCQIIGSALDSVLTPDGADDALELTNIIQDVTNQMQADENPESTLKEWSNFYEKGH